MGETIADCRIGKSYTYPTLSCPKCGFNFVSEAPMLGKEGAIKEAFIKYFKKEEIKCHCEMNNLFPEIILHQLLKRNDSEFIDRNNTSICLEVIGVIGSIIQVEDKNNTKVEFNLGENSKVIDYYYFHKEENADFWECRERHPQTHSVNENGIIVRLENGNQEKGAIFYTFIKDYDTNTPRGKLIEAFEHFYFKRYKSMIIPANICIEDTLDKILYDFLSKLTSRSKVKNSFSDMTYSSRLNFILPLLSLKEDIPILDKDILDTLNELRGLRNSMAHGSSEINVDKPKAAKLLCATILGYYYLDYIKTLL